GLDLEKNADALRESIARLHEANVPVALFVDHSIESMERSKELGATAVEIHTGEFCNAAKRARTTRDMLTLLDPLQKAAKRAHKLELQVHVGHGLNYPNAHWLQLVKHVEEANIGHAIV